MAETMLYVNEHLHDALWDGDDDPAWIRSFQPGDYLVLTVANGESLVVSGHPAERGTFDLFLAAMDLEELADDPRFADVAADDPANHTNRSPYPMLHLLREQSVARAVAAHPDPEAIPMRNAARLRVSDSGAM